MWGIPKSEKDHDDLKAMIKVYEKICKLKTIIQSVKEPSKGICEEILRLCNIFFLENL